MPISPRSSIESFLIHDQKWDSPKYILALILNPKFWVLVPSLWCDYTSSTLVSPTLNRVQPPSWELLSVPGKARPSTCGAAFGI